MAPLVSAWGPPGPSLLFGHSGAAVASAPGLAFLAGARLCPLATVLCGLVLPRLSSRPEQLRRLTAQLASLASLEDVVTHGLQSLLESPAGLAAEIPVDERALPASLSRPRSRSPLLQKAPPTGSAAPSCSASAVALAWLSRAVLLFPPGALAAPVASRAPWDLLSALVSLRASLARPAPHLVHAPPPRLLTPLRLPPGWLARGSSGAAECRRRTRRHAKRSMWREI